MATDNLTLKEKDEVRKEHYTVIKDCLNELGYDVEFAVKGSGAKTILINLPFVKNEKEGWLELALTVKGDDYDGYVAREDGERIMAEKVEKEEKKKREDEKRKAENERKRAEKEATKAARRVAQTNEGG